MVKGISCDCEQAELTRLLSSARQQGKPDPYVGKRRWTRYALGMGLELTTNPSDPSAAWRVIMHNIAGGGFGFWSRRQVREGTGIHVREWSKDADAIWLPARVTYCKVGIRGYLVGASFDHPVAPDMPTVAQPAAATEPHAPQASPAGQPTDPASLRTKCAIVSVVACCGGLVGGVLAGSCVTYVGTNPWSISLLLVLVASACAYPLGWLGGTLIFKPELSFIKAFCTAIGHVAKGAPSPPAVPAAPSKELEPLQRALLEVRTTWRTREDSERHQRQKLEELHQLKSNILSIVSHDLRTPMTSILLYARMLADEMDTLPEKDRHRFLTIIMEECTRLSRLVDDLLEVQRLESGQARWDTQPQDLSEVVRACTRLFEAMAASKSIDFTAECPASLPLVEADADKISQVLSNLLSNAMKYTPAEGKVHFSAEAGGKEVVFRVTDTGPGIPRDKWDQIFDRFTQLSNPDVREIAGVGLGLFIVRQIVERHGGAVWVDSSEGRGSEFTVSLPTRSAIVNSECEQRVPDSARRAVVCDADPHLAAIIAQTLRMDGFEVRVAHSGCRLLVHLARNQTDLVVTDMLLPDMDASELLEAIGEVSPRSFRLIIHSYAGDAPELRRRGADVVLSRPASAEELLQAVRLAMQRQSAERRSILLVNSSSGDLRRFKRQLADVGHLPIVAQTLTDAVTLIQDYPIDAVLLASDLLDDDWAGLKKLGHGADNDLRVFVLCEHIRKKERRLADAHGVTVLSGQPENEAQSLAALTSSPETLIPEQVHEADSCLR